MTTTPKPPWWCWFGVSCAGATGNPFRKMIGQVGGLRGGVGVSSRACDHRRIFSHDFHGALAAINDELVPGLDGRRCVAGTGHSWQIIFTTHNGRMAHHAPDIGHGGLDLAENWAPTWCGNRSDQDFAGLDLG